MSSLGRLCAESMSFAFRGLSQAGKREERVCKRLHSLLKLSALMRVDTYFKGNCSTTALLPSGFLLASGQRVMMIYFYFSFLPTDTSPIPSLAEQVLQV